MGGVPLLAMSGIAVVLHFQQQHDDARSILAAGVILGAVLTASQLYLIRTWTLLRQSLMYLLIMTLTVLPALFLSGWFPTETPSDAALIIGVFLILGGFLWMLGTALFGLIMPWARVRRQARPIHRDPSVRAGTPPPAAG